MEMSGATLGKGLNRGLGTLLAGSLAFLIEFVAEKSGRQRRAIFIGAAVFVIGTLRFSKNLDCFGMMFLFRRIF